MKDASDSFRLPPISVPEKMHPKVAVILWQARGTSDCLLARRPARQLSEGHALWIPAGMTHEIHVHADSIIFPLHIHSTPRTLMEPAWIAVDAELHLLILALMQVQGTLFRPENELERRIIRAVQERLVTYTELPMPTTPSARAVAEHIRDHPEDAVSLQELARREHSSMRTIERAFFLDTGMTLRSWRQHRRMEVAGTTIRHAKSLSGVANQVGYRSVSAFRKAFKEHFGLTPNDYRRRYRERV